MPIRNINRTVGTMLSGEIAKRYGHEGLPDDTIHVRFAGSAGQSFGRVLAKGVTLDLIGDTNDYCGKGLSGGRISVQPSPKFRGDPRENIITGNVVLYGAIAGEAYFRGVAGERFAVRNSGAHAVVEGVGRPRLRIHDRRHRRGAGHDRAQLRGRHVRRDRLRARRGRRVSPAAATSRWSISSRSCPKSSRKRRSRATSGIKGSSDEAVLTRLIEQHARYTGSGRAREILDNWPQFRTRFVKVFPKEYRRALAELAAKHKRIAA